MLVVRHPVLFLWRLPWQLHVRFIWRYQLGLLKGHGLIDAITHQLKVQRLLVLLWLCNLAYIFKVTQPERWCRS